MQYKPYFAAVVSSKKEVNTMIRLTLIDSVKIKGFCRNFYLLLTSSLNFSQNNLNDYKIGVSVNWAGLGVGFDNKAKVSVCGFNML